MRIGYGFDAHKFDKNRKLYLGGVLIPHDKGLLGHSDADCLLHAITDALLGAAALGDIGRHFPPGCEEYKDIKSIILLKKTREMLYEKSYRVINVDATISAQRPKLLPYIMQMRKNISQVLDISVDDVNIKATTTEGMGYEGREEGISSAAVCLIYKT
jgi:2-C-methyl-D-erythritol 2,4-cyclodiphosphate synthase